MRSTKTVLHALIVEDSEEDALLLARHLSQGGYQPQWHRVETPEALTDALDKQKWDVVFADYSMPRFSGTQALALVRERGIDVPFIFVSGSIGEDMAVEAMRLGAHDYVMKGNMKRLLPAIERELREARARREQRRTEEELRLLQTLGTATAMAADADAAVVVTLIEVCHTTGWNLAQAWMPRDDGAVIECSPVWHRQGSRFEKFHASSVGHGLAPGDDIPGRVWSTKHALWIADLAGHGTFGRTAAAASMGLKSAVGIPVVADKVVLAVLEFFSTEPRPEDDRQIKLLTAVADQLGGVMQRKRAERRLYHLAHFDALTGLPNRALFMDRLRQAMVDANRHQRLVGVALLDLDRFKTINDSLGHGIGDLLLKGACDRLSSCLRNGDTVARFGGDEFTLILADMGHQDHAVQVGKKILSSLSQPFHIGGQELFTSASLGMTLYPNDDRTVEGLLYNADIAMYRAKESGGNTYAFYSVDMTIKARERLALENDLRRGLEHDQFVLDYQPLIHLSTREIYAVEALVRWRHPQRGLIAPGDFIPLAEESGLIVPLGEWVLRSACEQFEAYRKLRPELLLAVNVSARQFQHPDLPDMVLATLQRTGFDPNRLDLEITESVLMHNMANALAVMRKLSDHGIRFSVDDFGIGYSSLAYLKGLPISRIKIDRSFVRDIPQDHNDVAIASAIISMAHNLGMQVTAEGVETREQLELLRERGCDAVQGYYYSRPIPPAEIVRRLTQGAPWD